jgi:hypothetical protein
MTTEQIVRVLTTRIEHGDYDVDGFPAERQLASELNTSRMTLRKAIERLVDIGLVCRLANGRLTVRDCSSSPTSRAQIALIAHTMEPGNDNQLFFEWNQAIQAHMESEHGVVRTELVRHFNEPVLHSLIARMDGVFLLPGDQTVDTDTQELIAASERLVVLDQDWSPLGIPSIVRFPARFLRQLWDHLYECGHRRILLFNTQPVSPQIQSYLDEWNLWCRMHRVDGTLINRPVREFGRIIRNSYRIMKERVDSGELRETAVCATTNNAVIGVIRALHSAGIRVGPDVSVCTVHSPLARYMVPSVTSLLNPELDPYLRACIDWFVSGGSISEWSSSLLLEPASLTLFDGETTAPTQVTTMPANPGSA